MKSIEPVFLSCFSCVTGSRRSPNPREMLENVGSKRWVIFSFPSKILKKKGLKDTSNYYGDYWTKFV